MRKPSATALASKKLESDEDLLLFDSPPLAATEARTPLRLSSYNGHADAAAKKKPAGISVGYSSEEIRDFLWLLGAILIIAILHSYLPNRGRAPHSVVDVVTSARIFPGQ